MNDIAALLYRWQSLSGALLGGIISLTTALVIVGSAIKRSQRTATALLMVDVLSISRVSEHLKTLAQHESIATDRYPIWVSEKLNWRRPRLSSAYESHVANVIDIDERLSAHLSLLKMVYSGLEEHLARIESDADDRRGGHGERVPRALQATESDASVVADSLELAGAHAVCAAHLLEQFVLSRVPRFLKRFRMYFCPTAIEKQSKELLHKGTHQKQREDNSHNGRRP